MTDAWGNLLQKNITKCSAENLSVTADAHNWLHASGTDYLYDAAGNMTYDATASLSYTFDQENRLTGAAGYTYTYDADGNRVRKSNGNLAANGTLYWYMTPGDDHPSMRKPRMPGAQLCEIVRSRSQMETAIFGKPYHYPIESSAAKRQKNPLAACVQRAVITMWIIWGASAGRTRR